VDQPPRYRRPDPSGEEPLPRFDGGFPREPRLPIRRGGGGYGGPPGANPWLVGLAVAVVLAAVSIIAFNLFAPSEESAATTTSEGITTTAPDNGSTTPDDGSTTSTDGSSTTSTSPDGTVTTLTSLPSGEIPPIAAGEAVPAADLSLATDSIGPLTFGDDGDTVLERLVGTYGDPTQDTGFIVGNGSWGECTGDSIRVVQWGTLTVVVKGEYDNSVFVSYRLDVKYGSITSPTTDLQTKSGLRVEDTVAQLKDIYSGWNIQYVVDADVGLVFELRAQLGSDLLLWGPVSSQDDTGLVTGIYSPNSCGKF
jgi:hypothetical protein